MSKKNPTELYLESMLNEAPHYAEHWKTMLGFHMKKLWHQLTEAIYEFLKAPGVKKDVDLVQFYTKMITECKDYTLKANLLSISQIALDISKQIHGRDAKRAFIATLAENVTKNKEASIMVASALCELTILDADLDKAVADLDNIEKDLKASHAADSNVFAAFYKAKILFHKIKTQPQEFYQAGLQYLAYAQIDKVDREERSSLAFDLGLAALVAEDIYNFGELLENQILDSLVGTPHAWLAQILEAFNAGDINKWLDLQNEYAGLLNQHFILTSNRKLLDEKIAVMSVMNLMFSKRSNDRSIEFAEIASVSRLEVSDVELLLMKALSLGLIKGRIDQVKSRMQITWVQPRVLSMDQIKQMKERLDGWTGKVKNTLLSLENHLTPELSQ